MPITKQKLDISDFKVDLSPLPLPKKVLMCRPDYFEVIMVKNPHMEGNIGKVISKKAIKQWEILRQNFTQIGLTVSVMTPLKGLDDMVFTSNQGLAFLDTERNKIFLKAKMFAVNRQGEILPCTEWFSAQGYEITDPFDEEDDFFEGNGEALWHRGRRLLIMAYGHRTMRTSLEKIKRELGVDSVFVKLTDPKFYHLDTCLAMLDPESALIYPGAFDEFSLEIIENLFPRLLVVDEDEAASKLAVNCFCPDNKHVVINAGCNKTNQLLKRNGFKPIEVDTSEFVKSGGSVFCMKLAYF